MLSNFDISFKAALAYHTNMPRKKTSKELFEQCLSETSIHGFRYTVDKQFHFCENVFWTIVTLGFVLMGVYLVHVNYNTTN